MPLPPQNLVAISTSPEPHYGALAQPEPAPELPGGSARTQAQSALRKLLHAWELDQPNYGTARWNPLSELIPPGARVVLKPNWVLDTNKNPEGGFECLVTHSSVISAVLDYVLLTNPSRLILGDAPVQGCDFRNLCQLARVDALVQQAANRGIELHVSDFRRTIVSRDPQQPTRAEDARDLSNFVLFDLATASRLESLSGAAEKMRVTQYDPDRLRRTHAPGRHQYLIAREIIDADVVINLPKLKAHMKSGVTGALKNLIGINGNKEFLPHHLKGGSRQGGDCYQGYSFWQNFAENLFDAANRRQGKKSAATLDWIAQKCLGMARATGHQGLVEGAWHGNQTIWRTCLDINRILIYGRPDGSMADTAQRRTIHITDAIIGGQGSGPLSPDPIPSGFLTAALNPAAAEWVNVLSMGWDPSKIPLVREAFGPFPWPVAEFSPQSIRVAGEFGPLAVDQLRPPRGVTFRPSSGWQGHVEAELPLEVTV